jgi:hypothetical protein
MTHLVVRGDDPSSWVVRVCRGMTHLVVRGDDPMIHSDNPRTLGFHDLVTSHR